MLAALVTGPLTPGAGEGVEGAARARLLLKQTPGKGSVGLGLCVGADEGGGGGVSRGGGGGEVSRAGLGVSGEPDPLVSGVPLVIVHIVRAMLATAVVVVVVVRVGEPEHGLGPGQG